MNATTTQERNALTLPQRAALALESSKAEAELRALVEKSVDIKAVIDHAGREQAHRIGMTLKNARVAIQKIGKAAREDAQAFAKSVIAEENRLCEIVTGEEDRVFGLRDEYDAKVEAERQAKIEAERKRIDAIKKDIGSLHDVAMAAVGKSAAEIAVALEWAQNVAAVEITAERFAEFLPDAQRVIAEVTTKLADLHGAALASEKAAAEAAAAQKAEAERIAEERAELARLRAEAAERDRLAKAEAERVAAAQAADLARQRAEQQAEFDRQAAVQRAEAAKLAEQRKAIEDAEKARQEAENAFQAKLRAQAEEDERRKREAEQAVESAARATIAGIAADMASDLAGEVSAPVSDLQPLAAEAADAELSAELFPTDGELVADIRQMCAELYGMSTDEVDARMAVFNYTEAAGLVAV